tara:strand:+ start:232 stop:459 length:228 start_codon:yes stop_codon:yes gene_type:complete
MKLTKENFNKVFNYIDDQVNSTSGEFDEETNIVDAVERTVEMILLDSFVMARQKQDLIDAYKESDNETNNRRNKN